MVKLNESLDENKEITQGMIDKNITYLNDLLITAAKKSFFIKKEGSGKEGKKGEKMEGREEGRKERREKRRKQGREKEGRKEWRK